MKVWTDLDEIWQRAMTLAWTSFCEGNLPIAAVLTDPEGHIVSEGRNHFYNEGVKKGGTLYESIRNQNK